MAESFITVDNGIITGKHHGDINSDLHGTPYFGHKKNKCCFNAQVIVGEPVTYYTSNWERRKDGVLIDEGLMTMPEGHIREGDELRPMTNEERVIAGLDNPPEGFRVESGKIVMLSSDELHSIGLLNDDDWKKIKLSEAEAELNRRLAELNTEESKAMAELDEGYSAERKARLLALLSVKQQKGWPLNINWPEGCVGVDK